MFKKKNLLILGANSAILRSFIEEISAGDNYKIFASYNKNKPNYPNIKYFKLDFNWSDSKIISQLQKNKIKADIIINTVGGTFGVREYDFNISHWEKILKLNILKHIHINNFYLKTMIKKRFGRFIFFSSSAVEDTSAPITYSVSKALLENYIQKSARIFGKKNIFFNCIKTSLVIDKNNNWFKASKKNPKKVNDFVKEYISVKKAGNSDDFKEYVKLLISSKNKFLNGSIIKIDGATKFIN
jgi:NAD(P)-dependent dehydrogenase (short-subunit alcohol dehydrogenase family)